MRFATIWSPRMKRRSDATRTARMTRIGVAELGQVADEGHLPFFADGGVAAQGRVAGQAPPLGSGGRESRPSRTASASAMARCWRARGARSSPRRTPRRRGSDGIRGRCARTLGSAATTSAAATRRRRSRASRRGRDRRGCGRGRRVGARGAGRGRGPSSSTLGRRCGLPELADALARADRHRGACPADAMSAMIRTMRAHRVRYCTACPVRDLVTERAATAGPVAG